MKKEPVTNDFSKILCGWMDATYLTCEDISKLTGFNIFLISHHRTGKNKPRKSTIQKYAQAFGLDWISFLQGATPANLKKYYKNQGE